MRLFCGSAARRADGAWSVVKGVRLVSSETITTQVLADLNVVEAQLNRVAKALDENKADDAAKALALAQGRGVEFLQWFRRR
jgi:hypothetical protein